MSEAGGEIVIEVAYAKPEMQQLVSLTVPEGTTVEHAISISGILDHFPEIDLACQTVGIFGKVCTLQQRLRSGDRVEIYRPLIADPKIMRREAAR